ncbi:acyltransferase [Pinibacter soli]|uniref:Acyltransferase n=1 Tax=Pinibacter soli TaxID=3044211 RepID=A0ABT6R7T9_9BACT|nr:acyltransferase [Pinibacter soli]MDI3318633.1 acyltransferase [Pinibacter soli]
MFITKVLFKLGIDKFIKRLLDEMQHRESSALLKRFKNVGSTIYIGPRPYIKNPHCITIGNNFFALYNLRIEAVDQYFDNKFSPEIIIGSNVSINTDCHIGCIDKVVIGNNVMIGSRVLITDHEHGNTHTIEKNVTPAKRPLTSKGPVIIGDNVWICEGACILNGVTIGEGAIVAANAVVSKDVAPYSIVGGIPAKEIRKLNVI